MASERIFCVLLATCILLSQTGALELVPRIIGGVSIFDRCRAPYNSMVALQFSKGSFPITFCSAVMVTDTYLVTAAMCLFTIAENTNELAIAVIGEKDTRMPGEPGEQRIDIKSFKIHFQYNRNISANDIGLIELARPATLGVCVKPALRMQEDPNACDDVDETCQMAGWGSYVEDTKNPVNSRLPRVAALTVYSSLITTLLATRSTEQPPVGSLYAESRNPAHKACFFDWGDVVSCRRNGYNVLKGIISNHNCNSQRSYPVLMVDIPYYQDWIDRCTKDWNSCPALK